eukprot:363731_1
MAPQSHEDQLLQQAIQQSLMEENVNKISNGQLMEKDVVDQKSASSDKMEIDEHDEPKEEEINLEEQLEPQPDGKDPEATAIRIRMPNGSILQRLFKKNAKVNQLYIWCTLSLNG